MSAETEHPQFLRDLMGHLVGVFNSIVTQAEGARELAGHARGQRELLSNVVDDAVIRRRGSRVFLR